MRCFSFFYFMLLLVSFLSHLNIFFKILPSLLLLLSFSCSAEPPIKPKSSRATLFLVNSGDNIKLNCPLPKVAAFKWTKDGTLLVPDNRILVEHERLHIRHATLTDSGLYTCHASGFKATDEVHFFVNVTGEMAQLES